MAFGAFCSTRRWSAASAAWILLGWAAWHTVYGHRHRVRFGMTTGLAGLGAWSFLMAMGPRRRPDADPAPGTPGRHRRRASPPPGRSRRHAARPGRRRRPQPHHACDDGCRGRAGLRPGRRRRAPARAGSISTCCGPRRWLRWGCGCWCDAPTPSGPAGAFGSYGSCASAGASGSHRMAPDPESRKLREGDPGPARRPAGGVPPRSRAQAAPPCAEWRVAARGVGQGQAVAGADRMARSVKFVLTPFSGRDWRVLTRGVGQGQAVAGADRMAAR